MKPFSLGTQWNKERKSPSACKCFSDGPHGEAVSPIVVAPVPVARTEAQKVTAVGAVGRRGPIVAVAANIVETATAVVAITGGGETVAFLLNGSWDGLYQTTNHRSTGVP